MKVQFGIPEIAFHSSDSRITVKILDGPLEIGWHHCAITSGFIADFYAQQFQSLHNEYKYIKHNIEYLANELIENAIKFRFRGDITIESIIDSDSFIIKVSNEIDERTSSDFETYLAGITSGDPEDLLIQKIEHNAENPNSNASGLGLLTLMSDYGSRLAWRFDRPEERMRMRVETFGSIPIFTNQL
ncbi:MAG: ATP-binding protein [Rhizobiales bacterium]|nr:ATP-binding protein [Hyphomicrobiales bacterium]|tara:strand:- start:1989 stop:2549 length:561 start_codon:yes stop_codon:yes gene_type:complete